MNDLGQIVNAATLVDLLRYRATHQPHQVAYTFLVDGETETQTLTYQELDRLSQIIAAKLQSFCPPGKRVLLLYPPSLEYIAAFFGCLYAGVVAIPAYPPRPNRSLSRLQGILYDAQATVALTTKSILSTLERRFDQTPELKTLQWFATDTLPPHQPSGWQPPALERHTLAFLQYTSGSTATPKGVMITHQNLLHNLSLIYRCFEHGPHSCGVIWLPPYHDMGLIGGVLQPLYGGFPVILMSPLIFLQSPVRWLQAISRYRATTSGGPNFAYDLVCRRVTPEQLQTLDLSSWDLAFNGAEPISHVTLERFAAMFAPCGFRREAFYSCYGMAEATLMVSGGQKNKPPIYKTVQGAALEQHRVVAAHAAEEGARILVGCGQTLPDQHIAIVHPETLTECGPGEVGEIWVSGPSVAQGYWQKLEETQQTFQAILEGRGRQEIGINAAFPIGPFLRTGDLGFMENGELFVAGRLKDLIIINGYNYYPQDIEWTVEHCHPLIRPNCAAGFSVTVGGEEKLVVVAEVDYREYRQQVAASNGAAAHAPKSKGAMPYSDTIGEAIRRSVSKNHDLQIYSALLLKPGSIPKTSSGKIQRHACRARFLAGTLEVIEEFNGAED